RCSKRHSSNASESYGFPRIRRSTWYLQIDPAGNNRDLSVRLALRVDDALKLAQHVHAGQKLRQAAIRLALLLDRRDELPVFEFDAIHGHIDFGQVDLVVFA